MVMTNGSQLSTMPFVLSNPSNFVIQGDVHNIEKNLVSMMMESYDDGEQGFCGNGRRSGCPDR